MNIRRIYFTNAGTDILDAKSTPLRLKCQKDTSISNTATVPSGRFKAIQMDGAERDTSLSTGWRQVVCRKPGTLSELLQVQA